MDFRSYLECDSDDDEVIQLSAQSLAALTEFYAEQAAQREHEEALKLSTVQSSTLQFQEDWQLSQFWYDKETADILAREAIRVAGKVGRIACISCPTIYKRLIEIKPEICIAKVFEYDTRFSIYGEDFVFYDYNYPLKSIPDNWHNTFDVVIADPPFLSEECLTKISETIKALTKQHIILCTGVTMESLAKELLQVEKCRYEPKHERNLQNEFRCYANYDLDSGILVKN
ncbi:hypothetical protein CHUAL_007798 [Chamberlinius hualienensis]